MQINTEEEVLRKALVHALGVPGVTVTSKLAQQLKTLIKDEKPADEINRQ